MANEALLQRAAVHHDAVFRAENTGVTSNSLPRSSKNSLCLLLSECPHLHDAVQHVFDHVHLQTRHSILHSRFEVNLSRLTDAPMSVVIELPSIATLTGTRTDRKVMTRVGHLIGMLPPAVTVLIFGRSRSPSWELAAMQSIMRIVGFKSSLHDYCRFASHVSSSPLGHTIRILCNQVVSDNRCL